jgi:hypothetical protein
LEKLARDAARGIAGPEAVEQVEVETVVDLDHRPAMAAFDRTTPDEQTDVLALMMARLRD